MARTVTVEQAYQIVNDIYNQATGQEAIKVVDDSTFTVVAGKLSGLHYNQIAPAMLEVASGIEIVERPYTAPLRMVWHDEDGYQSRVLKVSYLDNANAETNPAWSLKTGDQLNVHTVKMPMVYEAEIWGANTIMAKVTISKKQMKTALGSAQALARFYSGLLQNIENQLEQQKEGMCRLTLLSAINGVYAGKSGETAHQVIHLLTEWNAKYGPQTETGGTSKYDTIDKLRRDATEYNRFIRYCYARMNTVAKEMSNRDVRYHVNPTKDPRFTADIAAGRTTGNIPRHTPGDRLKCCVAWPYLEEIGTDVLSGVWRTEYLKMVEHEDLLFWQTPEAPTDIKITSTYMDSASERKTAEGDISNVFAFMYDVDMLGVGVVDQDEGETPYDQERKAYNHIWDMDVKSWNDFTEKAALFLLD